VSCVNSTFFGDKIKEYEIGATFVIDKGRYRFGIYTEREDLNLAEVAKEYGGGGHPKAAGFYTNLEWFRINFLNGPK